MSSFLLAHCLEIFVAEVFVLFHCNSTGVSQKTTITCCQLSYALPTDDVQIDEIIQHTTTVIIAFSSYGFDYIAVLNGDWTNVIKRSC